MVEHPKYRVVESIHDSRWPFTSEHYKGATIATGRIMRQRHGDQAIDNLDRDVRRLPDDEMAGKLTKHGKIKVSGKIPSNERPLVAEWEATFFKLVRKRKRNR